MRRRAGRKKKAIAYRFIDPESLDGKPLYARLRRILDQHHDDVAGARFALAYHVSWKPDADGRLKLGQCRRVSDLDREIVDTYDFIIVINRAWWENAMVTDQQRDALLDHECCHAAVKFDSETGDPAVDERGRTVYRLRAHTIEEFQEVVDRYGCYKRDLESFAQALRRAEIKVGGAWVGFSSLQETLREIGVEVSREVIATWPDSERREVMTWALLRQGAGEQVNVGLSPSMPACLAAAVRPPADHTAQ